jgi:uncharacterized protein YndB with AHSA1/START domain
MSVVSVEIDIAAPPQQVFELAMAPERTPEWVTIVREVKSFDPPPMRVGWKMEQTLVLRGVPFDVEWEAVEVDVPWVAVFEGKGPVRSKARIENRLEEKPDGTTRYIYRNEFKAPLGPLGATASRVVAGGIPEREANGSLEQLKALLEGGS